MTPHTQGQLVWTREKPQDEGWFWLSNRPSKIPKIVYVGRQRAYGNRLCVILEYDRMPIDDLYDENPSGICSIPRWSGPIPLPVEPKEGEV